MVTAVIMAGGKGTRLKLTGEKPLLKLKDRPMIDWVIQNLKKSSIEKLVVATSKHTPQTHKYLENRGMEIIKTPGNGYLEDLKIILSYFEAKDPSEVLLFISSDLPMVKGEIIDEILSRYHESHLHAMCVAVPLEIFNKYDLKPSFVWEGIVPSGVNILRSLNKIQDEEVILVPKIELALNINTCHDIKVLERLLVIE
ncbi:MAG: TIGR00454 family protein [Euryarchaeota archaeon]